jgi:hypothetical protein
MSRISGRFTKNGNVLVSSASYYIVSKTECWKKPKHTKERIALLEPLNTPLNEYQNRMYVSFHSYGPKNK